MTSLSSSVEAVLIEARALLETHYGSRLQRVILFGSQARGDAHPESDIDVLVVLKDPVSTLQEIKALSSMAYDLETKHDLYVQFVVSTEERYQIPWHPLMRNVHREGIAL